MGPFAPAFPTSCTFGHLKWGCRDSGWSSGAVSAGSGSKQGLPISELWSLQLSHAALTAWVAQTSRTNQEWCEPWLLSLVQSPFSLPWDHDSPPAEAQLYCQKAQGWWPRGDKNHPNRTVHSSDHPPVAANEEGQHGITSAIGFHHLQTVPIEEVVNADLAICTGTDDPEEEQGHVENLPGRGQSNRQGVSSGKLLGTFVVPGILCMVRSQWF